MTETPIDLAHRTMEAAPDDDSARLRFLERIMDAELFLLLEQEAQGDAVEPQAFDVDGQAFVVAFDRQDRLSEFAGEAAFASMSGRNLAALLAQEGLGLGLNLEVAPSAFLLPPEGVSWMANMRDQAPNVVAEIPEEVMSPRGVPDTLLEGLGEKLATVQGAADLAYLVSVRYRGGVQSHMLAFVDPAPGADQALASAVSEALVFSGLEAGSIDVAFLQASDPFALKLAMVGLKIDLDRPEVSEGPVAPGMDPDKPPRLV